MKRHSDQLGIYILLLQILIEKQIWKQFILTRLIVWVAGNNCYYYYNKQKSQQRPRDKMSYALTHQERILVLRTL